MFGAAAGGAALAGASSGLASPASAAGSTTLTLELDKRRYLAGELMTLHITENVTRPDRRTIVITDTTGAQWTKVSDDGVVPVFTAEAKSSRSGANSVTATLTRVSDGASSAAAASYFLGALWRPRFAGDRRDRMMMGMAVTDNPRSNLQWDQAMGLLGAARSNVSVRRCFLSNWISKARIEEWADWADAEGIYPVISFKVPRADWAGVAAGRYDSDLDLLCATLEERDAQGRAPVCIAVHHEPTGDGDLPTWARMQEYLSNRFAPWKSVFCFTTISNGYEWGPHLGKPSEIAKMYPKSLIDALNRNGHILGCDTYDSSSPTRLDYTKYDRSSLKIAAFAEWARVEGVQRLGIGEFGCHDDVDLQRCWDVVDQNRDLFAYVCYFNSGQNSRADWRMISDGYAPDPAVTSYIDRGGSAASASRLAAGRRMFGACLAG